MLKKELIESQKKELDRRIARLEAGHTKFYNWNEIKNKLMEISRNNTSKKR
jgi:putative addiction module component (TIGR02574 family)